jgi:hypothetical protein
MDMKDLSCKTCVTSTLNGNQVTGIEAERVTDLKEEDQEPTTIPQRWNPRITCVLWKVKLAPIARRVTCDVDGTEEVSINVEEAIDIKDEIPEAITFPPIKSEHEHDK